jgi:acyl-CoA synthetase (AMP-forming)/AMP-acid ligase II
MNDKPALPTRLKSGMLAVRGPMVPTAAFPPGIEKSGGAFFATEQDRFVDTGFMCRLDNDKQQLTVTGKVGGLAAIGGYSLRPADIEARLAKVDADATIVAVPDALLGQRLAAQGRERTGAFLQAFGLNALVAGAFNKRKPAA